MDITHVWFEFLGSLGTVCKPLPNLMIWGLMSVGLCAFVLRRTNGQRKAGH